MVLLKKQKISAPRPVNPELRRLSMATTTWSLLYATLCTCLTTHAPARDPGLKDLGYVLQPLRQRGNREERAKVKQSRMIEQVETGSKRKARPSPVPIVRTAHLWPNPANTSSINSGQVARVAHGTHRTHDVSPDLYNHLPQLVSLTSVLRRQGNCRRRVP